jgi:hypothetical protein
MTIKKRGRPVGVKNKPKPIVKRSNIDDFAAALKQGSKKLKTYKPASLQDTLKEWDRLDQQSNTDWEVIALKQEDRLKAYIAENEELAKICVMRWDEIQHLKYLVTYLERKNEDSSV